LLATQGAGDDLVHGVHGVEHVDFANIPVARLARKDSVTLILRQLFTLLGCPTLFLARFAYVSGEALARER
jgi:hypothetical protein